MIDKEKIEKELEKLYKRKKELYNVWPMALDKLFIERQIDAIDKTIDFLKKKI